MTSLLQQVFGSRRYDARKLEKSTIKFTLKEKGSTHHLATYQGIPLECVSFKVQYSL
jgi:hypothetical protein